MKAEKDKYKVGSARPSVRPSVKPLRYNKHGNKDSHLAPPSARHGRLLQALTGTLRHCPWTLLRRTPPGHPSDSLFRSLNRYFCPPPTLPLTLSFSHSSSLTPIQSPAMQLLIRHVIMCSPWVSLALDGELFINLL